MFSGYKKYYQRLIIFILIISLPVNAQVVQELTSELTEHGIQIFRVTGQTPFRPRWRDPLRLVTSVYIRNPRSRI